ncbi:MAG TPA: hypothetical protein VK919_07650 [Solirubrobacterales bacterium]|nr:hypothetical protein [Solirubrobacterales bacterium]
MTTSEATPGDSLSPPVPTVADVERIAAVSDPVVRNLQITQCYCELSRAFAARTDGEPANWCTFATWASKQAGQTIRKEDLARTFERLFAQSSEVTSVLDAAVASVSELSAERPPQPIRDAVWKALEPTSAFDRASDAVARGNRKVFEEIGREFARVLALPTLGGTIDQTEFKSFCEGLSPGDPPDGQDYLRQAFTAYAAAFRESDRKQRAELVLLANLAIGWHEQTRLQPQIAEALDAPFEEPVKLRRDLLGDLLSLRVGFALRLLLELVPGRSTAVKKVLDDLDRGVKEIAHEAITELLMTLALPGEVLSLSRDVPGTFPAALQTIDNPELRTLLGLLDPTPDTTRGSGTDDWSILTDRIHFIADLFRVYQERPTLLGDPFTAEQVAVIKSGHRPSGRL